MKIEGLAELEADLAAISRRVRDLRPLLAEIGEQVVSQTAISFISGRGPDGKAWIPSRRVSTAGGQTLIDTGRLRGSFGYDATDRQVEIGSNVVYAAIHQFGGVAGRGHGVTLPARPFMPTSVDQIDDLDTIMNRFLERVLDDR